MQSRKCYALRTSIKILAVPDQFVTNWSLTMAKRRLWVNWFQICGLLLLSDTIWSKCGHYRISISSPSSTKSHSLVLIRTNPLRATLSKANLGQYRSSNSLCPQQWQSNCNHDYIVVVEQQAGIILIWNNHSAKTTNPCHIGQVLIKLGHNIVSPFAFVCAIIYLCGFVSDYFKGVSRFGFRNFCN